MMMKKTTFVIGSALLALSLASACSKSKPAATTPVENTEVAPATGGDAYGAAPTETPAEAPPAEGEPAPAPATP
jgi:hypothetical protein